MGSVQKGVAREEKCKKEDQSDQQTPSCTKAMRSKEDAVGLEGGRDTCGFGGEFGQGGLAKRDWAASQREYTSCRVNRSELGRPGRSGYSKDFGRET